MTNMRGVQKLSGKRTAGEAHPRPKKLSCRPESLGARELSLFAPCLSYPDFLHTLFSTQLDVILVIYLIAITAEAMSGALAAGRRNMDIFGVVVIAFVTALGGGTIRDMVLGNYPIGWTQHPAYVLPGGVRRPADYRHCTLHETHETCVPAAGRHGADRAFLDRQRRRHPPGL